MFIAKLHFVYTDNRFICKRTPQTTLYLCMPFLLLAHCFKTQSMGVREQNCCGHDMIQEEKNVNNVNSSIQDDYAFLRIVMYI
ncbi:hypothetical protein AB205_0033050 [Aquarana catesbeiana]|uniref:Uncharacterized protein n=1 Tax=Aquarana catesbeiana TaxID=8400 RepID=A0A2G9SIU2_AQUCT|nr:hypothetical protein AB205_0033050 [Aquarana catesbeiana]